MPPAWWPAQPAALTMVPLLLALGTWLTVTGLVLLIYDYGRRSR
jgi:hypothetical protein